jgi:hypothetical protein
VNLLRHVLIQSRFGNFLAPTGTASGPAAPTVSDQLAFYKPAVNAEAKSTSMRRTIRAGLVVICAASALGACGRGGSGGSVSGSTLSDSDASNLIIQYEQHNCAWGQYEYSLDDTQKIADFFSDQVRQGKLTVLPQTWSDMGGHEQNFPYTDRHGLNLKAHYGWLMHGWVIVKDCFFIPTAIQVLDTTYDSNGKGATIVFRNTVDEPSDFAQRFFALEGQPSKHQMWIGPAFDNDMQEVDGLELVALLQKLDATGWRVNTIMQSQR